MLHKDSGDHPDRPSGSKVVVEAELTFEAYRLGIDDIDQQHRTLFDYVERLNTAIAGGDRWLAAYQILAELEHWAKIHFAVEESLMSICCYPDMTRHMRQHAIFSAKVVQLKQESLTKDISGKASEFLRNWLMQHVGSDDRKYAEHFLRINESFAAERVRLRPDLPQFSPARGQHRGTV